MLKKSLIVAIALAIGVSPLLPRVFADSGAWSNTIATSAWDYGTYTVERLSLSEQSDVYNYEDAVFVTTESSACDDPTVCELVDVTLFAHGEFMTLEAVSSDITDAFSHKAQDGRFVYRVPSASDDSWGTVYEYNPVTGSSLALASLDRADNGLSFLSFATEGDRIFTSILASDEETGDVESKLSVFDYTSGFERDDFTYRLTAPYQEIVDVHEGIALVQFTFEGGYEQLWLVDQTQRTMNAIPDTWTEPNGDIVGAHFLNDGSVRFFRNFRLWTFDPTSDETPVDAGGATLSWFVDADDAIQLKGERMAYIDAENGLYVSAVDGVRKLGMTLDGSFTLTENAVYFQKFDGTYVGYTFATNSWETLAYLVTDTFEDIRVGIDADGNVWYENLTTGYLLNVGYGNEPVVLSDREHAYWTGADGNVYEVTFSPVLDLARENVEAFRAIGQRGVYLVSGGEMWLVPDETVYFTWFDSWDDTLLVSQATIRTYLSTYEFKGDVKMAPGTRVKAASSNRVYVVGNDYELHWITSETVANAIYGSAWNQNIVEVNDTYLWKYATGAALETAADVRSI